MNGIIKIIAVLVIFGVLIGVAYAQFAKPEDAIKYRQSVMFIIAQHFGRLGAMVKGKQPFDQKTFASNAAVIENLAGLPWEAFLVPGSDRGKTTMKSSVLKNPEDLKGLKILVQQSPVAMQLVEAMGASPTPIAWGELYTSLQQGVVDGAENNPPSLYTSKHYEICKFYSLDEHTMPPDILLISTRTWGQLSAEQQKILQDAVDESVTHQQKLWAEFEQKSMDEVKAAGVKIIKPDKAPFRKSVESMIKEYDGTAIGELVKRISEVQ